MEKEIVIKVENIEKQYRLGTIGGGTLRGDLQSWWARKRGKEDPNVKIGQEVYIGNKKFMALNGINFEVYKGERLGIIGGNGAGKSTTLKLLSRVTAPTRGNIYINGRISSMLEVGTGFHPELTGRENIYLNGAILGMTRSEVDNKIEDIIDFSECRQFIDTPVKRYSSGMYVKLAFSVAAHLDSEILIMDEVLAVGDMAFQKKCIQKMNDVSRKDGRTILYVSHNMNTIRQLCDRALVLDHGKIIFDGIVEAAIAIYMKTTIQFKKHYDYSNMKRTPYETKYVQLLGLDILNQTGNRVQKGEDFHCLLHCKTNKNVKNVGLRFVIYHYDGTVIGTVFSDKTVTLDSNRIFDLKLKFSTKNFSDGKYRVGAIAYESDQCGNQVGIDRVDPAFFFEIVSAENSLIWLHQLWGHVQFDDMIFEEMRILQV